MRRRIREAEKTGAIELNLSGRKDGKDTGVETLNWLPPELEGLTSLQSLDLSNFSGDLSSLEHLTKLQSLDLNRCLGIRRFAPLESLLPRLKELVLSGCQFDDLPHEVCGERYENVLVKVRAHYGLQPPQVFVSYALGRYLTHRLRSSQIRQRILLPPAPLIFSILRGPAESCACTAAKRNLIFLLDVGTR
jgi:Leucine-rich repeat (LRR) protein